MECHLGVSHCRCMYYTYTAVHVVITYHVNITYMYMYMEKFSKSLLLSCYVLCTGERLVL